MLQFRASVVLKELIQTSHKRSLSDILSFKKTLPSACRFSSAYSNGKTPKLNIVRNGRYIPFIQPLYSRRFLCTKPEGAIAPETVMTDETIQETTADKYEIHLTLEPLVVTSTWCVFNSSAGASKHQWMCGNVALCLHLTASVCSLFIFLFQRVDHML